MGNLNMIPTTFALEIKNKLILCIIKFENLKMNFGKDSQKMMLSFKLINSNKEDIKKYEDYLEEVEYNRIRNAG